MTIERATVAAATEMFEKCKNWGRWGANDQLGSANLITQDKRRRALQLGTRALGAADVRGRA